MPRRPEIDRPFWSLGRDEVLRILKTKERGLTDAEAERRTQTYGTNRMPQKPKLTRTRILLNQCKSPLIGVLGVAGLVTLTLQEWEDAIVILAAVTINAALGYWQEAKAENILESLKSYVRTRTRVRRDGEVRERDAETLVPGDILSLSAGDRIPADARLIYTSDVEIDESILTGESLPVAKSTKPVGEASLLAERYSMAYAGTHLVQGLADAVVVSTGERTELGKIAILTSGREEEPTPLQRHVAQLSRQIGIVLGIVIFGLFLLGIQRGEPVVTMFLVAVAVAVSAIPEGLPVALTVIFAAGVQRLAKQKAVVRRLLAAETLGSTTIILTDKTGTLTEGRMELVEILSITHDEKTLLEEALCSINALVEGTDLPIDQWRISGRPVEVAIARAAGTRGILPGRCSIVDRIPFDSRVKYSAVLLDGDHPRAVYLGAPEQLLSACVLKSSELDRWKTEIDRRTQTGERLIGLASFPTKTLTREAAGKLPRGLQFRGIFVLRDPLRANVKDAITRIQKAGVRTILVTGDHPGTAQYIAHELSLPAEPHNILTGTDLDRLNETELGVRLKQVTVFARVTPEQKLRLAHLYQRRGEVVAMTGDGVNDAPALQAADIGVAVGSGTEVAKAASDLVILDDNYETIVRAIEQGRTIIDNIRRVIIYLVSHGLDELMLIGGAVILGIPLPLNALQILYVNFFTDSFPAVAFALEERHAQDSIPGDGKGLLRTQHKWMVVVFGSVTSGLLFLFYLTLLFSGLPKTLVSTMVFTTLSIHTLLVAFSFRRLEKSVLTYSPFGNPWLCLGVVFGLILTFCGVYLPFFNHVLGTTPLPAHLLGVSVGMSAFIVTVIEFLKAAFARSSKS